MYNQNNNLFTAYLSFLPFLQFTKKKQQNSNYANNLILKIHKFASNFGTIETEGK